MTLRRASIVIAATALFSAACGGAWAADRPSRPVDFIVRPEPVTAAPNAGKALRYEATKGRLGFTLNIQQPLERPTVANDVQAGAYFRITPSLRVGGSVALGDQDLKLRTTPGRPADAPKITLQTAFKF